MADRSLYSDTSSPMPTGLEFLDQYGDRGTQLFNAAIWPLSSVSGTANAVTASCDPPLLAGLVEHMKFLITWAADNTGGMTLAIDGGTPVPVLTASGSAMQAGDALTGVRVILEYVGGAFRVIGGASSGSAAGPYVTTITASGTWVKPTGYADDVLVILEAWGGGGGGGRCASAVAGGGGGGGYSRREMRYADVPSSLSITIGAGGAGRTGSTGNGSPGGNTAIGSLLTAYRGGGGEGVGTAPAAGGGGGGELSAGVTAGLGGAVGGGTGNSGGPALTTWGGGGGGPSGTVTGGDAVHGAAGGGGATSASAGSAGGTSLFAGNGGAGGTSPVAGSAPGGGGGAGGNNNNGAAGARGEVRIRIVV